MSIEFLRRKVLEISGAPADYDGLLKLVGDARYVLLGEATHGSHEFYDARAEITRRLIAEKRFNIVAVEADWPDAYRVNRYVRGQGPDREAVTALSDFQGFPAWMWRNADVLGFVGWLRDFNDGRRPEDRVGFYGLDLYSLHRSMDAVIRYLARVDTEAAERARRRYACFDHFGADPQVYGSMVSFGVDRTCEQEVVRQLADLRRSAERYLSRNGMAAEDEQFSAEQNARLALNAERYYREMYRGAISSWNLRDEHMADSLDALFDHFDRRSHAKVVVWAHNSHVGDARATSVALGGEWNIGQLIRERHPGQAILIGFTTYDGTVSAAVEWGGPVEKMDVRPARPHSVEDLFHDVGVPRFFLNLRDVGRAVDIDKPMLERAIGVIYRPQTELASHYYRCRIRQQFDAVIHFDHTRAVEPLDLVSLLQPGHLPSTAPTGM